MSRARSRSSVVVYTRRRCGRRASHDAHREALGAVPAPLLCRLRGAWLLWLFIGRRHDESRGTLLARQKPSAVPQDARSTPSAEQPRLSEPAAPARVTGRALATSWPTYLG